MTDSARQSQIQAAQAKDRENVSTNRRRKIMSAIEGYLYIAPTIIVLTVFVFFPIISAFQLSLNRAAPFGNATIFVGFENYQRLLERTFDLGNITSALLPVVAVVVVGALAAVVRSRRRGESPLAYRGYYQALGTLIILIMIGAIVDGPLLVSLIFTIGTVIPGILLSVVLAIMLSLPVRHLSWFHRLLIFVPIVISSAVTGVLFRWIYHPVVGYINYMLSIVGIAGPNWLSDADWALVAVMGAVVWRQLGFNVIIALAGLQNINSTFYEAAKVDGASFWDRVRHVTIPLLSPTLFFLFIINTINSLQVFGEIDTLTQGGPGQATRTLLYDIYFLAFRGTPQRGLASAESFLLFLLIVLLSIVQFRVANNRVHYQ